MAWGTAAVLQHERGAEGGLQPPTPPAVRDPACTAKPPVQQQQQQQHAPLPPPSPPLPMPEPRGRRRSPSPGRAREAAAPAASAPAGAAAPHAPAARRGTAGRPQHDMPPAEAAAFAAAKLGLTDQLAAQLAPAAGAPRGGASAAGGAPHPLAAARDEEGRCCLHYAAGYGHEGCVELLLARGADPGAQDVGGDTALHFACVHGQAMSAYLIARARPRACEARNERGQRPVEAAAACRGAEARGEALNALLLACAGDAGDASAGTIRDLLAAGAVADTWAPDGSSALMQAAAADAALVVEALLYEGGARVELQDALGRSALMFAAAADAPAAAAALLRANASLAARDRRGRGALDHAPAGSEVRALLQARLDELEAAAAARQAELLESLERSGAGGEGAEQAPRRRRTKGAQAAGGAGASRAREPQPAQQEAGAGDARRSFAAAGARAGAGAEPLPPPPPPQQQQQQQQPKQEQPKPPVSWRSVCAGAQGKPAQSLPAEEQAAADAGGGDWEVVGPRAHRKAAAAAATAAPASGAGDKASSGAPLAAAAWPKLGGGTAQTAAAPKRAAAAAVRRASGSGGAATNAPVVAPAPAATGLTQKHSAWKQPAQAPAAPLPSQTPQQQQEPQQQQQQQQQQQATSGAPAATPRLSFRAAVVGDAPAAEPAAGPPADAIPMAAAAPAAGAAAEPIAAGAAALEPSAEAARAGQQMTVLCPGAAEPAAVEHQHSANSPSAAARDPPSTEQGHTNALPPPAPDVVGDAAAAPEAGAASSADAGAAGGQARCLRDDNARLRRQIAALGALHDAELSCVLSDAATHEAAAVQRAVAAAAAAAVAAECGRWVARLAALGVPPHALLVLAVGDIGSCDGEIATSAAAAAIAAAAATASGGVQVAALNDQLSRAMHMMASAGARGRGTTADCGGGGAPEGGIAPSAGTLALAAALPSADCPSLGLVCAGGDIGEGGAFSVASDTPTSVSSAALSDSLLEHLRGEYQGGGSCFVAAARCSSPPFSGTGSPSKPRAGRATGGGDAAPAAPRPRLASSGASSDCGGGGSDAASAGSWELDPVVEPALAAPACERTVGAGAKRASEAGCGAAAAAGQA